VDSNGCEVPGCGPGIDTTTNVTSPVLSKGEVTVWPNPTTGAFNVRSAEEGALVLFDMMGRMVAEYKINAGETSLQLPYRLAAGLYVGKFMGGSGGMQVIRMVKE